MGEANAAEGMRGDESLLDEEDELSDCREREFGTEKIMMIQRVSDQIGWNDSAHKGSMWDLLFLRDIIQCTSRSSVSFC